MRGLINEFKSHQGRYNHKELSFTVPHSVCSVSPNENAISIFVSTKTLPTTPEMQGGHTKCLLVLCVQQLTRSLVSQYEPIRVSLFCLFSFFKGFSRH